MSGMERLKKKIESAQLVVKDKLETVYETHQMFPKEVYIRILSAQHHLNYGVQRHFLIAASHPDMARKKKLRHFLYEFANEEELHYLIAERDLEELGVKPLPCPFDVELWRAFFDKVVYTNPFIRLGATAVLENILGKSLEVFNKLLTNTRYLTEKNTRYIIIHKHEALPHGDEVLAALEEAKLKENHFQDLEQGALKGTIIFLRLLDWALFGKEAY
ncbi:MAG: hypothetical protein JSS53_07180 [Proteobacteria bacterium]|nr:hypothetical protein [Pseudomonadota bacterium]